MSKIGARSNLTTSIYSLIHSNYEMRQLNFGHIKVKFFSQANLKLFEII